MKRGKKEEKKRKRGKEEKRKRGKEEKRRKEKEKKRKNLLSRSADWGQTSNRKRSSSIEINRD